MRLRTRAKGGVTALVGWILVATGLISAVAALGEGGQFYSWVNATWLPEPSLAVTLSWTLLAVAVADAGGGILLIGLARPERDREEMLLLDPLKYAPYRHPWRRVIPWCALVVAVLVIPSLWAIPVEHSFHDDFAVAACFAGASTYVELPNGAVFTYEWSSENGQPIGEVYAPGGPRADYPTSDLFLNSSFGYSVIQSNGTPIQIWACDFSSSSPVNDTVDVVGIYYAPIL